MSKRVLAFAAQAAQSVQQPPNLTALQRAQSLRLSSSSPERDLTDLELPRMSFRPLGRSAMPEPSPQETAMQWLQEQPQGDADDDLQT